MRKPVVFVIDDDEATLKALTRTISSAGWDVESFSSPQSFLDVYDSDTPGCIVLDLRMPKIGGLAVQQRLAERGSRTPIIFITAYADVSAAVRAMKGGAIDFLEKPFSSEQILRRIEQAIAWDADARRGRAEQREVERRLALLTPREREVLDLILAGKLNKQIAGLLGIAQRTVEVHRQQIMKKMQAQTGIDLARMVLSARSAPAARTPAKQNPQYPRALV
jgi:FixJ family two-component response regulator